MAETLVLPESAEREERYRTLLPQIEAVIDPEPDLIANLANVAACLKQAFSFYWVGFYLRKRDELVLGPFQGPLACTRIRKGKGVCGVAWEQAKTQLVPDVNAFPGHIACSADSRSEIVVPIIRAGEVLAVLDVDSDRLDDFGDTDARHLERLASMLSERLAFDVP